MLGWAAAAVAGTVVVTEDDDLQAVVDVARDGDVVRLATGIYTWSLEVRRSIALEPVDDTADVLLVPAGEVGAVHVVGGAAEVTLRGLRVDGDGSFRAATVDLGSLVLDGVTVENTKSVDRGGAVAVGRDAGSLTIRHSRLRSSTAESTGGFVDFAGTGALVIVDSELVGGHAAALGGALAVRGGDLRIETSRFEGNSSAVGGGAVYVDGATSARVATSAFEGNASDGIRGGGALFAQDVALEVADCRFTGNTVRDEGGGAAVVRSSADGGLPASFVRCDFVGNVAAADGDGGALWSNGKVDLTLDRDLFCGNTTDGDGGAVFHRGPLTVQGSLFLANTAAGKGGAWLSFAQSTATRSTLAGNAAPVGPGIYVRAEGSTLGTAHLQQHTADAAPGPVLDGSDVGLGTIVDSLAWEVGALASTAWTVEGPTVELAQPVPDVDAAACHPEELRPGLGSPLVGPLGTLGAFGGDAPFEPDQDGDGFRGEGDCDDGDASVYPGATEGIGLDRDCDGRLLCYPDADGDGARGAFPIEVTGGVCGAGTAPAEAPLDCDDGTAARAPGGEERPGDGVDGDCDERELCWLDRDGDRVGDGETVVSADLDCDDVAEAARDGDPCPDDPRDRCGRPVAGALFFCGCATGGAPGGAVAGLLAAAVAGRRRSGRGDGR